MPSKQTIGWGGKIERSITGAANSFTRIPEAKGLGVPQVQTEYQEVTSLDSVGGFREYIKGLKDAGEITVNAGYTPLGYEQQLADQAAVNPVYYRVTMPLTPGQTTGDLFEFQGYPTPSVQADDIGAPVAMSVVIRTTGPVTWTKGAGA
jgi:hypothetical protein